MENTIKPAIGRLEVVFEALNEHYFENQLSKPIITISPDTTHGAYGWCTTRKVWHEKGSDIDSGYYEINICAEYLSRSFEKVCATLLHEMVHLFDVQNGIRDCSRSGTYHNSRFKKAADSHGLTVERNEKYGWSVTDLNEDSRSFLSTIEEKSVSALSRDSGKRLSNNSAGSKSDAVPPERSSSSIKYICPSCGTIIRATREVHVLCADCSTPEHPVSFEKAERKQL